MLKIIINIFSLSNNVQRNLLYVVLTIEPSTSSFKISIIVPIFLVLILHCIVFIDINMCHSIFTNKTSNYLCLQVTQGNMNEEELCYHN